MAYLTDARGNEYLGQLDQIGGGTITDARVSSAVLGALNAELVMDLNGHSSARFDVRTVVASTLTLVWEGSMDGVNYFTLPVYQEVTETYAASLVLAAATVANIMTCNDLAFNRIHAMCSTSTSFVSSRNDATH